MTVYTILFFSSAEISIPLLKRLNNSKQFKINGFFCQPDRPIGRGHEMKKSRLKKVAENLNLKIYQPEKLNNAIELMSELEKPDFLLTFAYGQIISDEWLSFPKIEALNVHTSLLPKHRGASPIQSAILNGDTETGITLMRMVKDMDSGPVCGFAKISLPKHMTAGILHDELSELAKEFVPNRILKVIDKGDDLFVEQDNSSASYCSKISKEDGFVDFKESAETIARKFHAYMPWPGLWTTYKGKRLKLIDLEAVKGDFAPGGIKCENHDLLIGTTDGLLKIKQMQLEGKQCMHADQFIIGKQEFCSDSLPS